MLAYARMLFGRKNAGGALDTQFVTRGSTGTVANANRRIGYVQAGTAFGAAIGSIDDGTSDLYAAAPILALYWDESNAECSFCVSGIQANSGWTQMVINGATTFLRADATFANFSYTVWSWPTAVSTIFPAGVSTVVFS